MLMLMTFFSNIRLDCACLACYVILFVAVSDLAVAALAEPLNSYDDSRNIREREKTFVIIVWASVNEINFAVRVI